MFTIRTLVSSMLAIMLLVMNGCATNPPKEEGTSSADSLYDGKAKTLYDAKHKPTTSAEAIKLGNRALQVGDVDRALYRFVVAYELDPSAFEALHKVGVIHAQRGNLDRAALAFELVLKQNPDNINTLLEMGLIDINRRRYQQAETHLARVVEAKPEVWRAHNGLGVLADLNKDFAAAQKHYKEALKLYPGSPTLLNNLGYSNYLSGDWERARQYMEAALDADPNYRKALLNLGLILVRQRLYHDAVATFEKVMEKPKVYERIGTLCMVEGNYDDADRFLNLAIGASSTYYKEAYDKLERLRALRKPSSRPGTTTPGGMMKSLTMQELSLADSDSRLKSKDILYPPDLSIGVTRRPNRFKLDQSIWQSLDNK